MASVLDQILESYTSNGRLLGAAICGEGRGGSSGRLRFDDDAPFTEDSVCWIASMTKLLVSIAAVQLIERQVIRLDSDLRTLVPELAKVRVLDGFGADNVLLLNKLDTPITLQHLLSHSSGFAYDIFDPELVKWRKVTGSDLSADSCSLEGFRVPLKFRPGQGWVYGVGLDWVGHTIEVLTGVSLEEYTQQNILRLLGMTSTTFRIADHPALASRRAAMTTYDKVRGRVVAAPSGQPDIAAMDCGGSGLFSTATDYSKLLGALTDGGKGILKKETVDSIIQPQLSDPKFLTDVMDGELHDFFCPDFPKHTPVNHGLAGLLNIERLPERRNGGSITWSGIVSSRWWYDAEAEIAATMFVQVMPCQDNPAPSMYFELEKAVYASLSHKF